MTVVTHTLVDVERNPLPNRTITIALYGTVDSKDVGVTGWYEDGAQSISSVQARSDATGQLSADLPPNSGISPANTWYSWMLPTGERVKCVVPVSASPVALADIRVLSGSDPLGPTITGKSAYQLAVENGFVGTETEWLASLVGTPGADSTVPGPPGPPLLIRGTVATATDLDAMTGVPGDGWITLDDGHLHTWVDDTTRWVDGGKIQGPAGADGTGIASAAVDGAGDLTLTLTNATTLGPWHVAGQDGTPGAAATIAIDPSSGGVPHGTATSVENTGTASAAILRFLIEQAQDGSQILTGTGTPTGSAPDGSLYLNTGNGDVWRYSGGAWSGAPILNIMGPAGSPTPYELRGDGSPYGTLVPASAGVYYTDTAATSGAIRWVSTGTTNTSWVVTVGDTGWRTVMVSTTPGWQGVQVFLRRTADTVHLKLVSTGSTAVTNVYTLPTGFRSTGIPGGGSDAWSGPRPGSGGSANFSIASFSVIAYDGGTAFATAHPVYPTTDPWPTALPGTPA